MLIAHAPVGYIAGVALRRWSSIPGLVGAAVAGALAPDLDMLLFLADPTIHHHAWPTHWPVVWLGLAAAAAPGLARARSRTPAALVLVFAASGFLHLVLDTVAGDVRWLAPISDRAWSLVRVTRRFEPWWLNFVLHWTFAVELALVALAGGVWLRRRRSAQKTTGTSS